MHDQKLLENTQLIKQFSLSDLIVKNEKNYPWFLLLPRVEGTVELTDLSSEQQQQLMNEINAVATWVKQQFSPDKINVATIGNIVSQLHIHIVGRFKTDPLWPGSIWQPNYVPEVYGAEEWDELLSDLAQRADFLV